MAPCTGTSWRWVAAAFSPAIPRPRSTICMLELAGVAKPHVVFLPTATGDADRAVEAFESAWGPRDVHDGRRLHVRRSRAARGAGRGRGRGRRRGRQHREHARDLAAARGRQGPARALGERRGARRRLRRRELLVRGVRDRLVLDRARRARRRARASRPAATARTSTARSAAARSTRACSPRDSRPGSHATTAPPPCIAAPSSSRSSPTVPARSGTAPRRPASSRIETRLLR